MSSIKLLLPISAKYLELILRGEKMVEFRKQNFNQNISEILFFQTKSKGGVIVSSEVFGIERLGYEEAWRKYAAIAGVSREEFTSYIGSSAMVTCLALRLPIVILPVSLKDFGISRSPQGGKYIL
ncbi:MAG: ASCH domain-containing protein [Leptothrix sp. (in: b-proteobacteria)]